MFACCLLLKEINHTTVCGVKKSGQFRTTETMVCVLVRHHSEDHNTHFTIKMRTFLRGKDFSNHRSYGCGNPVSKNQSSARRSGRSFDSSSSVFGPLAKAPIKTIGCDVTQICTPETLSGSNGFLQTGSGPQRALTGPQTSL